MAPKFKSSFLGILIKFNSNSEILYQRNLLKSCENHDILSWHPTKISNFKQTFQKFQTRETTKTGKNAMKELYKGFI